MDVNTYSVSMQNGCRVLQGRVPLSDLGALLEAWSGLDEEWIADAALSQALGVTLVAGPRTATQAWREELGLSIGKDGQA